MISANDPIYFPLRKLVVFRLVKKRKSGSKMDPDPFRLLLHPLSLARDLSTYGSFLKPFSEDL